MPHTRNTRGTRNTHEQHDQYGQHEEYEEYEERMVRDTYAAAHGGLAVFDLDGTLADVRHRLHHVEGARRDWDAFFAAAVHDPPLAEGMALARRWARVCELAYVTGRPEQCRADTERWLAEHGLPTAPLWMRGPADRRPGRVAKPGLLRRLARGHLVEVVVDDDPEVCAAYRADGFPVVEADWARPSRTLRHVQEDEGRT